jgi:hypothetical protein
MCLPARGPSPHPHSSSAHSAVNTRLSLCSSTRLCMCSHIRPCAPSTRAETVVAASQKIARMYSRFCGPIPMSSSASRGFCTSCLCTSQRHLPSAPFISLLPPSSSLPPSLPPSLPLSSSTVNFLVHITTQGSIACALPFSRARVRRFFVSMSSNNNQATHADPAT